MWELLTMMLVCNPCARGVWFQILTRPLMLFVRWNFSLSIDEKIELDNICPTKTTTIIEKKTIEGNETGVDMDNH